MTACAFDICYCNWMQTDNAEKGITERRVSLCVFFFFSILGAAVKPATAGGDDVTRAE